MWGGCRRTGEATALSDLGASYLRWGHLDELDGAVTR